MVPWARNTLSMTVMNFIRTKCDFRRLIHPYRLCTNINLEYRWRWKSQDNIKELLTIPDDSISPQDKCTLDQSIANTVLDNTHICCEAKTAYLTLYDDFFNNSADVDSCNERTHTNSVSCNCDVSLGYCLEDLCDYMNRNDIATSDLFNKHHVPLPPTIDQLGPDICVANIKIDILGSWLTTGLVFNHEKIFGTCSFAELKHFILIGAIGPEVPTMWNQLGIKQIVRVQYSIDGVLDIWDFERDVMVDKQLWQINNINGIVIH